MALTVILKPTAGRALLVSRLKGVSPQLALAQLGGNNCRIPGIWEWSSCRDRLGPQPSLPIQKPPPITQPVRSAAQETQYEEVKRRAVGCGETGEKKLFLSQHFKRKPFANPPGQPFLLCRSACISSFPGAWMGLEMEMHSVNSFT